MGSVATGRDGERPSRQCGRLVGVPVSVGDSRPPAPPEGGTPAFGEPAGDRSGVASAKRFVSDAVGGGTSVDDNQAGAVFEPSALGGADGVGNGNGSGGPGWVTVLVMAAKRAVSATTGAGARVDDNRFGAVFEPGTTDGVEGGESGNGFGGLGWTTLLVTAAVKREVSITTGAATNGGGNQTDAAFDPNAEDGTTGGRGGNASGGMGRVRVAGPAAQPGSPDCDDSLPRTCGGGSVWSPGCSRSDGVAGLSRDSEPGTAPARGLRP